MQVEKLFSNHFFFWVLQIVGYAPEPTNKARNISPAWFCTGSPRGYNGLYVLKGNQRSLDKLNNNQCGLVNIIEYLHLMSLVKPFQVSLRLYDQGI